MLEIWQQLLFKHHRKWKSKKPSALEDEQPRMNEILLFGETVLESYSKMATELCQATNLILHSCLILLETNVNVVNGSSRILCFDSILMKMVSDYSDDKNFEAVDKSLLLSFLSTQICTRIIAPSPIKQTQHTSLIFNKKDGVRDSMRGIWSLISSIMERIDFSPGPKLSQEIPPTGERTQFLDRLFDKLVHTGFAATIMKNETQSRLASFGSTGAQLAFAASYSNNVEFFLKRLVQPLDADICDVRASFFWRILYKICIATFICLFCESIFRQ